MTGGKREYGTEMLLTPSVNILAVLCFVLRRVNRLGEAAAGNSMQSSPEMGRVSLPAFRKHEYVP